MVYQVEVEAEGPVFDGRWEPAFEKFYTRAENAVADEGVDMVLAALGGVLREPTGYYESQVIAERVADYAQVVGDNVIYGAWLEGVGSRNSPVTRFPGYFTFRMVTPRLAEHVAEIVERTALPELIRELEG